MKAIRNGVLISILTLAVAALLLIGQSMQPQRHTAVRADDSHEGCSMQTVAGSYGISTSGWIVFAGPAGPVADLGVITFDGNGGAAQTTTVSLNGAITAGGNVVISGDEQMAPARPSSLTRYIDSTRHSRMSFCQMSKTAICV